MVNLCDEQREEKLREELMWGVVRAATHLNYFLTLSPLEKGQRVREKEEAIKRYELWAARCLLHNVPIPIKPLGYQEEAED